MLWLSNMKIKSSNSRWLASLRFGLAKRFFQLTKSTSEFKGLSTCLSQTWVKTNPWKYDDMVPVPSIENKDSIVKAVMIKSVQDQIEKQALWINRRIMDVYALVYYCLRSYGKVLELKLTYFWCIENSYQSRTNLSWLPVQQNNTSKGTVDRGLKIPRKSPSWREPTKYADGSTI